MKKVPASWYGPAKDWFLMMGGVLVALIPVGGLFLLGLWMLKQIGLNEIK